MHEEIGGVGVNPVHEGQLGEQGAGDGELQRALGHSVKAPGFLIEREQEDFFSEAKHAGILKASARNANRNSVKDIHRPIRGRDWRGSCPAGTIQMTQVKVVGPIDERRERSTGCWNVLVEHRDYTSPAESAIRVRE